MEKTLSDEQVNKLHTAIEWSIKELAYPRSRRREALKMLVGKHYMPQGSDDIMPVNMLKLAVDIYVRHLAARSPRVLFSTRYEALRSTARDFELAVNQIPEEIRLTQTMRNVVTEALFGMGVVKCGLTTVSSTAEHAYGESFVDCVPFSTYFFDLSAPSWDAIQYEGNDYWMEYEDFKAAEWVSDEAKKDARPDTYSLNGAGGDLTDMAISVQSAPEAFRDRIHMRDVWLPKERLLVTYRVTNKKICHEVQFEDDMPSPYKRLGFTHVPGNLVPLPPVASWYDLNELYNAVFRKLGYSAAAYKAVLAFSGGDDQSITNLKKALHGDGITYHGAKPEKLEAGGVDAPTLAFSMKVRDLCSYFGSNLDSLGGLAPMTQTIGQDKLLADAAGAQLRDMADQTIDFVRDVFRALAYYEWTNPIKKRKLKKPIVGTDEFITVDWDSDHKNGEFSQYDLDIDVYSLQDQSPNLMLQKLIAFLQQVVMPMWPAAQAVGGTLDVEGVLKEAARLANMEWASGIIKFPDDPVVSQQSTPNQHIGASRSPTEGNSGSAAPVQSEADSMISQLMAGRPA